MSETKTPNRPKPADNGAVEARNPVELAEACAMVGFGLLVVGAGLLWSIAAALVLAGAILLVLGLAMALVRSR